MLSSRIVELSPRRYAWWGEDAHYGTSWVIPNACAAQNCVRLPMARRGRLAGSLLTHNDLLMTARAPLMDSLRGAAPLNG